MNGFAIKLAIQENVRIFGFSAAEHFPENFDTPILVNYEVAKFASEPITLQL